MGFPIFALESIKRLHTSLVNARDAAISRRDAELNDQKPTPQDTAVAPENPPPIGAPVPGGGGGGGGASNGKGNGGGGGGASNGKGNGGGVSGKTWVVVGVVTAAVIIGTVVMAKRKAAA